MFSKAPVITDAGLTLLVRAAGGEKITFTKFQVGSGTLSGAETEKTMTALKHVEMDNIGITQATGTESEGYVQLTGSFDSEDVLTSFYWTELGLIAEDEDGIEYLYAYAYDDVNADTVPAGGTTFVTMKQDISVIIAIGESENITVNVLPSASYASKAAFDAHTADKQNPHEVTAEQVGAAAASHTHAAGDITEGILPIEHGGTGVNSETALSALIRRLATETNFVVGTYTGDQTGRKDISLGFKPTAVFAFSPPSYDYRSSGVLVNQFSWRCSRSANFVAPDDTTQEGYTCSADVLFAKGHGGAAITDTGFAVGYAQGYCGVTNDNRLYFYIAFRA